METRAASLQQETQTPLYQLKADYLEITKLFKTLDAAGNPLISLETAMRGLAGAREGYGKSIADQFREPTLIGSAAKGSAAAYESIVKAQMGGDRQDKIRKAVEEAAKEAREHTRLLLSIDQKTEPAKIAQAPP